MALNKLHTTPSFENTSPAGERARKRTVLEIHHRRSGLTTQACANVSNEFVSARDCAVRAYARAHGLRSLNGVCTLGTDMWTVQHQMAQTFGFASPARFAKRVVGSSEQLICKAESLRVYKYRAGTDADAREIQRIILSEMCVTSLPSCDQGGALFEHRSASLK